ncbi:SufD family Fe-S cluster assembly protein [Alphaproteobacteria bacterium]|nr:SufD family Fe-S cluster assembly protein [Alphaproteobacteria bacterium]
MDVEKYIQNIKNSKLNQYFQSNLLAVNPFQNHKIENYKYAQLNKIDYNTSHKNIHSFDINVKDNFHDIFQKSKTIKDVALEYINWNFNAPDSAIRLSSLVKDPTIHFFDLNNFAEDVCVIDLSLYEELNFIFDYNKNEKISLVIVDSDTNKNKSPRNIKFNIYENSNIEILQMTYNKENSLTFYEFNQLHSSNVNLTVLQANNIQLRNEFYFNLASHCTAKISGTNFCNLGVNDNYSFIQHNEPDSSSREVFKSIVDHGAITNFQGKIYVDKIAQKTDGYQMSRSLLLDDISRSNNKPELEIYADDVKCSHGSTISKIDQDHLYYFNSRGISSDLATKILKKAFIQEVLDSIENVSLKKISDKIISSFL